MTEHRFRPSYTFALPIVVSSCVLGIGLAVLGELRADPEFDLAVAIGSGLVGAVVPALILLFFVRWYGQVRIDDACVAARDTLGRWRAVPWGAISAVRRVGLRPLTFVLVATPRSRWSLWLAKGLEPREALIMALVDAGPPAAAVREALGIVQHRLAVEAPASAAPG
jgi:hypothetical protein